MGAFSVFLERPRLYMRDFLAVGSLTFLQSDPPQEEKHRLCTRHSTSHIQNTLVFAIQTFYPVRGIDHPLDLGWIGQISEVGDVAFVLKALKRRVGLNVASINRAK